MKWALVLSGGAARGAVQWWTINELMEQHGMPSLVAGVSVGALNGLLAAQGRPGRLRRLYRQIDGVGWFQRPSLAVWKGLYTMAPLESRVLEELRSGHPMLCRYEVGVADLQGDRYWSIDVGTLPHRQAMADAIVASASEPGIHHYRTVRTPKGDRICADGGLFHVLPEVYAPGDLDQIHAVLCSPAKRRDWRRRRDVNGLLEVLSRTADIYNDRVVLDDLAMLQGYADQGTPVRLYAPDEDPGPSFDASRETIRYRLDTLGRRMWEQGTDL